MGGRHRICFCNASVGNLNMDHDTIDTLRLSYATVGWSIYDNTYEFSKLGCMGFTHCNTI